MNTQTHALVIGGSMAGLLAARVLSDHFDRVTIIERDSLPQGAEYRDGVPQARHLHALLAQGQEIMEGLFPGLHKDLEQVGSPRMRWGIDTLVIALSGRTKQFDSGIVTNVCSRVTIDWLIRKRLSEFKNVKFRQQCRVEMLVMDESGSTVTGIQLNSGETITADLVVDCSGRNSKAPEWLKSFGYNAPEETIVNAHLGYSTRWYELPEDADYDWVTILIQSRPAEGLYRGGGAIIVEGNRVVITLVGANKDYPPTDEDAFLDFAKSLADPHLYHVIQEATPISPIYGYRRTANRLRHYERLSRRPENFIVIGDAACAFNPLYGQGMTVAGMEALALGNLLKNYDAKQLRGFANAFQKRLAKTVKDTWTMATGEDYRYPATDGVRPGLMTRISHKYIDLMLLALPYDEVVGLAFLEAMNLTRSPMALMHPRILWRVLRYRLRRPRQPNIDADSKRQLQGI